MFAFSHSGITGTPQIYIAGGSVCVGDSMLRVSGRLSMIVPGLFVWCVDIKVQKAAPSKEDAYGTTKDLNNNKWQF